MRIDILARFTKFVRGSKVSPSMEVAVMCGVATQDYGHWVNHSTGKVPAKLVSVTAYSVQALKNWLIISLARSQSMLP